MSEPYVKRKIENECIWNKVRVALVEEKIAETCLEWLAHLRRRPTGGSNEKTNRGRLKKTSGETI